MGSLLPCVCSLISSSLIVHVLCHFYSRRMRPRRRRWRKRKWRDSSTSSCLQKKATLVSPQTRWACPRLHPILSCSTFSCAVLFYSLLFCFVLSYLALFCPPFHHVLSSPVPPVLICSNTFWSVLICHATQCLTMQCCYRNARGKPRSQRRMPKKATRKTELPSMLPPR